MTTSTTSTNIVLTDIQEALTALESILPEALTIVGTFWAPAGAVAKFLPLIQVLLQGVNTVATATGAQSAAPAVQSVMDHLTPGAPNAPELS